MKARRLCFEGSARLSQLSPFTRVFVFLKNLPITGTQSPLQTLSKAYRSKQTKVSPCWATMDRAMTIGNPILYAKGKIKENKWMRDRLLSVQSTVDNKCPHSYANGRSRRPNIKKLRLIEDRKRTIAQDNAIMLKSISNIMRHNNIDTWAKTRKYVPRMSNIGGRKKKLKFIQWENKILFDRINSATPWISNQAIKKDFDRQMRHLRHMGEYAYRGGGKKNGSFDKYWQHAVYEARPIHGKGSNMKRPSTHIGGSSPSKVLRQASRNVRTSQSMPMLGTNPYENTPPPTAPMGGRPSTSGSMGESEFSVSLSGSRPHSRARTPLQPIASWDKQSVGLEDVPEKKVFRLETPLSIVPKVPNPRLQSLDEIQTSSRLTSARSDRSLESLKSAQSDRPNEATGALIDVGTQDVETPVPSAKKETRTVSPVTGTAPVEVGTLSVPVNPALSASDDILTATMETLSVTD